MLICPHCFAPDQTFAVREVTTRVIHVGWSEDGAVVLDGPPQLTTHETMFCRTCEHAVTFAQGRDAWEAVQRRRRSEYEEALKAELRAHQWHRP
jgi:hypothetical protein